MGPNTCQLTIPMRDSIPVLNGYQAALLIHETDRDTHVIGLAPHAIESYKTQCFQYYTNSYSKPTVYRLSSKPDQRQLSAT